MSGPLSGYRVIELAGIGPGPFAAMLLADMGADVVRVERAGAVRASAPDTPHLDLLRRNRRNIALDLKHQRQVAAGKLKELALAACMRKPRVCRRAVAISSSKMSDLHGHIGRSREDLMQKHLCRVRAVSRWLSIDVRMCTTMAIR